MKTRPAAAGNGTGAGAAPTLEERLAMRRRPAGWSLGPQKWRMLLFLHWEVPAEAIQRLLPPELTVDTYEGRAYVGVVPFTMRGVRPWPVPPVPGLSSFDELNTRTYVHRNGREPGVWFFSLDAASLPAVLAARAGFALPYYHVKSRVGAIGGEPYYHFERRRAALVGTPLPARFDAAARIGELLGVAEPGTLEFFLLERYVLYADWRGRRMGLKVAQVHHRPYPIQRADVVDPVYETLFRSAGLPVPVGPPLVHFSPGVDVEVFRVRYPAGEPARSGVRGVR